MTREEVVNNLNEVFRSVFKNDSLEVKNEMTANDVDGWDSLSHQILIRETEEKFGVRFKLKELIRMKNVGDFIESILQKLSA